MRAKKIMAVLLAAALGVGMSLTACGGGKNGAGSSNPAGDQKQTGAENQGNSSEKVKLTFAIWDEVQKPVFDKIIAEFEKTHKNISVELQLTPWSQYWTKLDAAAGAQNAPDVFWMNTYLPKYTDAHILEPLDPYFQRDHLDKSKWAKAMIDFYQDKGVQYGMPKGMDVVVVAYNKAIFKKYGVAEPQKGWTWADFLQIEKNLENAIKAKGGDEYPLAMEIDSMQPSYLQLWEQDGIRVFTDGGNKTDLGKPEAKKAFTDILGLMDDHILPSYKLLSDTKGTDLFISQKAAVLYAGSWKSSVLDSADFAQDIGLIMMPKRTSGICTTAGISYAMSSSCKHKDAAWELIKFLGGEESNKMQAEGRVDFPAYLDAQKYYVPSFKHIDAQVFVDAAKDSVPFPVTRALAETFQVIGDQAGDIFSRQTSIDDGMKAMADGVQKAIDTYNAEHK